MKCLTCGNSDFTEKERDFQPEIKGEQVDVKVSCFVCDSCKALLMDAEQMKRFRRAASQVIMRRLNNNHSEAVG